MRFIGGNDIFSPDLLMTNSGILAPRCACSYNKGTGHFVVTANDVIVHAGTKEHKSIADDRVKELIFNDLDSSNYIDSFVFENPSKKECWFCYPTTGADFPSKAAIWNYKDDTWTFTDTINYMSAASGTITDSPAGDWNSDTGAWDADSSPWATESRKQVVVVNRVKALQIDLGYSFDGATPVAYVERTGLAIDSKDRMGKPKSSLKTRKLCTRLWPKISGTTSVNIRMGSQQDRGSPVVWANAQTFNPTTQKYLDWTVEGKFLAYRVEVISNEAWTLESADFEIEVIGTL